MPEEIIFRGIVQGILQDYISNVVLLVIASSILFGFAHLPNGSKGLLPKYWNWKFFWITFLAGLPLGLIFALTNSLLFPTILHASFLTLFKLFTKKKLN